MTLFHSQTRRHILNNDNRDGAMVHTKDGLYYKHRSDLKPTAYECMWIELIKKHKHILFGHSLDLLTLILLYFSSLEDSINSVLMV